MYLWRYWRDRLIISQISHVFKNLLSVFLNYLARGFWFHPLNLPTFAKFVIIVVGARTWNTLVFALFESLHSRLKNWRFLLLVPKESIIYLQLYLYIHLYLICCNNSLDVIISRSWILSLRLADLFLFISIHWWSEWCKVLLNWLFLVCVIAARSKMIKIIICTLTQFDFSFLFEDKCHVVLIIWNLLKRI